jgi:hypothetical protein
MNWDEWRGSLDGRPTFWSKTLLRFRGCKICLHKFVGVDDPNCFHTHPATAVRIILWGGYVEELDTAERRTWWPGMIGIVRPAYCHRATALNNGRASYSLWLRGPITNTVELRGSGWRA